MLKVLGRRTSSNVQKVLWCLEELQLAFVQEDYGGAFGKNNEPAYLALNPNGVVPTLIDDDLVLWESNTIVRYLASKYGAGQLYPTEPRQRALCERWMDWQLANMATAITPLFVQLVRTPPDKQDATKIEQAAQTTQRRFTVLDRYLTGQPYLNGDSLSLADIVLGMFAYLWFEMPVQRGEELPNVEDWYQRLRKRPPFQKHVVAIGLS